MGEAEGDGEAEVLVVGHIHTHIHIRTHRVGQPRSAPSSLRFLHRTEHMNKSQDEG